MILDSMWGNGVSGQMRATVRNQRKEAMELIEPDEGAIDRRAARSRAALKRSLVLLTLDKGYEGVTISDLCHKACVSRSTFYAHFTSKDDLKRSGLSQLRRELNAIQTEALCDPERGQTRLSFGPALFEHAQAHHGLFCALAGSPGATIAVDVIRGIIADLVRKELPAPTVDDNGLRELAARFVAGAYTTVLLGWLQDGAKPPLKQVEEQCRRLALHGLARPGAHPVSR